MAANTLPIGTPASSLPLKVLVDDVGFTSKLEPPDIATCIKDMVKGLKVKSVKEDGKKLSSHTLSLMANQSSLVMGKHFVPLHTVSEVLLGQKTYAFELARLHKTLPDNSESCSFSLVYTKDPIHDGVMDVVTDSPASCVTWTAGLIHLISIAHTGDVQAKYYNTVWTSVGSPSISVKQLSGLMTQLNFSASQAELKEKLHEVDANGNGKLEWLEFLVLMQKLRARPEIAELFRNYAKGDLKMSVAQLHQFLREDQKENVIPADCELIVKQWGAGTGDGLTLEAFEAYLTSDDNEAFHSKRKTIHQDMTHPLSHYWIASSHNTYILGDQLTGRASVDAYIKCLKKGCKCVEIDVWDGEDGNPIVYHGHTLMKPIKFTDVVHAIHDYAFVTSPYPLTLSLEIHACVAQQQKMAADFTSILGDMIAMPLHQDPASNNVLPSPENLKRKILLKGKVISPEKDKKPKDKKEKSDKKSDKKKKEEGKIAEELSKITFFKSGSTSDLKAATNTWAAWEMTSMAEAKVSKLASESASTVISFTQNHMARVYPKGTRMDSSNYEPMPGWITGCQYVALNYQTESDPMWINLGKFQENGCGYLLKPKFLIDPNTKYTPSAPVKTFSYSRIVVKVLSARQLPKYSSKKGEVVDPFVSIKVDGIPCDKREVKTKTIMNNGFNPTWHESFEFFITAPEIDQMLFCVDDWDQIGTNKVVHYSLPVGCIRPGYRVLPMYDTRGRLVPMCNLLCHFSFV